MSRHVALLALLLCFVIGCVQCGSISWGDDGHGSWSDQEHDMKEGMKSEMNKEMDMDMVMDNKKQMDHFVDFLWKAVKHGDLSEADAWALIEYYKHAKHCGMKADAKKGNGMMEWDSDEEEESRAPECDMGIGGDMSEKDAEINMEKKHEKALKMLSKTLIKDGASDHYNMKEWKGLLKNIMLSHKNRQDPVIDMSQEPTMKIAAKFWAPAMDIQLCGLTYTLPEVNEVIHMDGDEILAATNRHEPKVHITGLNGEPVHKGLYTMVWVDRTDLWPADGSPNTLLLNWMVINIPAGHVAKGDVVKPYLVTPSTDNYQVFVYEQYDRIHDDFAISQYTQSDTCRWHHRCHFQLAEFVAAYHLQQRAVGHFVVYVDPYTAYLDISQGYSSALVACDYYLDNVIPAGFQYLNVDTTDERAMRKSFNDYTSFYISQQKQGDEMIQFLLEAQFGSLINKFINKYNTNPLVPHFVEFLYDIGLKFWAEADSVELCGVAIDLPEVHRKIWLEDDKWDDGDRVELWTAEVRNAPMVKIAEREHLRNPLPGKQPLLEDELFTLLIVDTYYDGESQLVASPDKPYINWMVVNIKGDDVEHGDVLIPYLVWASSSHTHVLLYKQRSAITDLPMVQFTEGKCRSQNRCWFDMPRFVWRFGLELVGAGRYDIVVDSYGYTYQWRRGNRTPNEVCDAYLNAKKAAKKGGKEHDIDM